MSENQQYFCIEETFYQFQGVFEQKSSYDLMEFRVTPSCDSWHSSLRATRHQTTKYTSSSRQISARCRKDLRAVPVSPGGCAVWHTALHDTGKTPFQYSWYWKTPFHMLCDNQNRLGIFKTAPDGHLVTYFWGKCRGKIPVIQDATTLLWIRIHFLRIKVKKETPQINFRLFQRALSTYITRIYAYTV